MIVSGQKVQDTPLRTDIKVEAKDHETGSIFRVYYLEATLRPPNAIQDAQELSSPPQLYGNLCPCLVACPTSEFVVSSA